ncbi:hypothetical protein XANCAGTX0491_000729 [Xanthoria calcicola]
MASLPGVDACSTLSERGGELILMAPKPQMSTDTPGPTSVLQEATKDPTPLIDDDELPNLEDLIKKALANRSAPAPANFPAIANIPLSPPSTPSKFSRSNQSLASTSPHRGLRPTRGICPISLITPPQSSHKRTWSQQSWDQSEEDHASETPSTPSKRRRPTSSISSFACQPRSRTADGSQISCFEAQRASISVMKQVDWARVAERVACNRPGRVYKRAVQRVLEDWQEALDAAATVESDG